ncbi:hypothetical protein [Wansuia hejianensis]|uniref:Uncharacterized protein n=1 Tax=Wansuia hejianensis TaxID=2763667 RepID=A0A7G9G8M7_9FIRM|nr:hypothetical protein [Wansuia hejianensis]QNM07159.1 hypothetical protein H9Q79_09300 [Wansuia hejianensis]
MQLIMNDGQQIPIQSVVESGGVLKIRLLNQTSAGLKSIFRDALAVQKMTVRETAKTDVVYENYTELTCISEYTGAIWEVEMRQEGAATDTRLASLETEMPQKADETDLQQAIAELTMTMAALIGGGA